MILLPIRKLRLTATLILLTGLTACSSETVNETPTPPTGEVTLPKVETPQRTALETLLYRLEEGETIEVKLDTCPFDDEGWIAEGDPMGILKCGETYKATYDKDRVVWVVEGLDERRSNTEGQEFITTKEVAAPQLRLGELFLWGARFEANEDGTVSNIPLKTMQPTVVGHYK